MRILKLFISAILAALISGLYGAFQHAFFDSFIVIPLLVSLIITLIFKKLVSFGKGKEIICGLLIGLITYVAFIGVSYELFKSDIRNNVDESNYVVNVDSAIDNYLYYETGHKGVVGYIFIRAKSVPSNMKEVYEWAKADNINLPNFQGVIGEIFRFLAMVFMPLLVSLQPNNKRFINNRQ